MRPVYTSDDIRAQLAAHQLKRPDHLKAMHPDAPRFVRAAFSEWVTERDHLRTMLDRAIVAEESVWRDEQGNVITPARWDGRGNIHEMKTTQGAA